MALLCGNTHLLVGFIPKESRWDCLMDLLNSSGRTNSVQTGSYVKLSNSIGEQLLPDVDVVFPQKRIKKMKSHLQLMDEYL